MLGLLPQELFNSLFLKDIDQKTCKQSPIVAVQLKTIIASKNFLCGQARKFGIFLLDFAPPQWPSFVAGYQIASIRWMIS